MMGLSDARALHRARALCVFASVLAMCGCADELLPGDEGCRDVGYAISNKVYECGGDIERSNAAYEDFTRRHTCKITEIPSEAQLLDERIDDDPSDTVSKPYACSAAILRFTCAQADDFGADYDLWLANAERCTEVYTGADGEDLVAVEAEAP